MRSTIYTVGHKIIGHPSAKWQNFATMLFFGIKVHTTKHGIMLHAVSLNLPIPYLITLFTAYFGSLG